MSYIDGSRYEGKYADDKRHGAGVFIDTKGEVFEQTYHAGKEIQSNPLLVDTEVII